MSAVIIAMTKRPGTQQPLQLQVRGAMARQAEARTTTDGQAVLYALVEQPHDGLPILAKQHYGAGAAAQMAAHANARALRAGTPVVLYGDELHVTRHRGEPVLELRGQNTSVQMFGAVASQDERGLAA